MNVRTERVPSHLAATWSEMLALLRACWVIFRTHRLLAAGTALTAALLGALVWPHDRDWLSAVHVWRGASEDSPHRLAWYLSTFGDYPTYNFPVALLLWMYGVAAHKPHWRRIAMVALLGATLAGLFDDSLRLTLGRPRPDTHLADGFYGPAAALHGGYQSFPSGHAASTFGMALALLLVEWPLGVVTTAIACAVVWARMELNRHYPSDVLVGAIIGIYFGLLVGTAARRGLDAGDKFV